MSITLALLKKAEELRQSKDSDAYALQVEKETVRMHKKTRHTLIQLPWLVGIILALFTLLNSYLAMKTFVMQRFYNSDAKASSEKLDKIETLVSGNAQKIDSLSRKEAETHAKLQQLEQESSTQSFAIENLVKAKNTTLNKMNSLEFEIGKLKKPQQQQ